MRVYRQHLARVVERGQHPVGLRAQIRAAEPLQTIWVKRPHRGQEGRLHLLHRRIGRHAEQLGRRDAPQPARERMDPLA